MVTTPNTPYRDCLQVLISASTRSYSPYSYGALQNSSQVQLCRDQPRDPADSIKHVLNLVNQVLVMTVNPGFGIKPLLA